MKRSAVLAALASLAMALGACGGSENGSGEEESTDTEDYASEVEAPLSDAEDAVSGLDEVTSTSDFSDDVENFEAAEEGATELVDSLEASTPPSDVESEADDLISASEELADQAAEGAEAAENETTDGFPEGYPEEFEVVEDWEDAKDQFEEALSGT